MSISQIGTPTLFDSSATSGASASTTRNVAAGSMLVLVTQGTANLTTPTSWTLAKKQTCSDAPSYQTNIFFITGVSAGTFSLTVNRSGSSGSFRCTLSEWSGMGAATVDKTSGFGGYASGSGTAFPSTGTLTAAANLAIAGFYAAASVGDTLTAPSGWGVVDQSNSPYEYLISYLVTSSTAALSPYWGTGSNVENANALVVFKPGALPPAANLTSIDKNSLTAYSVNITVNSDTASGLLYAVAAQTSTTPRAEQIEAGTDAANFACPNIHANAVSGSNTLALTGLSANTFYYVSLVQDNGSVSNIPTITFTTLPPPPSITSVDNMSPHYQGSITINFENGGSSTGTVTIGGVSQTITSWTPLQAVIGSVNRGTNKYGVPLDIVVTSAIGSPSVPYTITQLLPQTGWDYIDQGSPFATLADRIEATPLDITSADQTTWDTHSGLVVMYPDGTIRIDPAMLDVPFSAQEWTASGGWGTAANQTVHISTSGGGSTFTAEFFGATASTIASAFGAALSTLSRAF